VPSPLSRVSDSAPLGARSGTCRLASFAKGGSFSTGVRTNRRLNSDEPGGARRLEVPAEDRLTSQSRTKLGREQVSQGAQLAIRRPRRTRMALAWPDVTTAAAAACLLVEVAWVAVLVYAAWAIF
jgi:hypothetical protein